MLGNDREATLLDVRGWLKSGPNTWLLRFNYDKNPLPMNGSRGHWSKGARAAREVRTRCTYLAAQLAQIPPLGRIEAQLTHYVTTSRVRDLDNYGLLEKPMFDGLVKAGVVEDDKPELMVKPRAQIVHVRDSEGLVHDACFILRVAQLDDEEVTA